MLKPITEVTLSAAETELLAALRKQKAHLINKPTELNEHQVYLQEKAAETRTLLAKLKVEGVLEQGIIEITPPSTRDVPDARVAQGLFLMSHTDLDRLGVSCVKGRHYT